MPVPTFEKYVFNPEIEPPPEDQIFEGFLARDDLAVWIGREKHRKTNFLLNLGVAAALGRNFLWLRFAASQPVRVCFIDYESKPQGLWRRYNKVVEELHLTELDLELLRANLHIVEVRRMLKHGLAVPPFPTGLEKPSVARNEAVVWWDKLVAELPADIYIVDPLRCFHAGDENDSMVEKLLARMRLHFRGAAVIISHHMRKVEAANEVSGNPNGKAKLDPASLTTDMRTWSDGARGSGAIKAHADVIVCQERRVENGNETVYFGAFMKDGPDLQPTAMEETGPESFVWRMRSSPPLHLARTVAILQAAGGRFATTTALIRALRVKGETESTAYRHLKELRAKGFVVENTAGLALQTIPYGNRIELIG